MQKIVPLSNDNEKHNQTTFKRIQKSKILLDDLLII